LSPAHYLIALITWQLRKCPPCEGYIQLHENIKMKLELELLGQKTMRSNQL